jgi:hypothetical protein
MADLRKTHARFWEDLRSRGPDAAAARAGARVEDGNILVPMAGRTFAVDPGAQSVEVREPRDGPLRADELEAVVLLTYLATADGFPLTGEWVSERGLTHGDAYFRGPHPLPVRELAKRFGNDPDGFVKAAEALGGRETGDADRGVEIPALPRVPLRFNLWIGDDEFPDADVRALFDRSATHYLILDGVVALVTIAVSALLDAAPERA